MKKQVENRNCANFTENWYRFSTKERKTVKVKGKVCKIDSETCYDVWFGDSRADKKIEGCPGSGRTRC